MKQDQQIIEELCAKDSPVAYKFLVEKYQNNVFSLCFRIIKNREQAEEVAQDTFVKCFKELKNLKDRSKFPNWLMKIAYSRAIDHIRKKKIQITEITADIEGTLMESKTPFLLTVDQNRKEIIKQALSMLPAEESAVINLYYLEDLPVKEISIIMDLSVSNVKIKLFRARNTLREVFGKYVKNELKDLK